MTTTRFARPRERPEEGVVVLDDDQAAVVETAPGTHLAVTGAPGSGKTTALVELCARRIRTGEIETDRFTAIVPTRLSANRLRDRLALRIGTPSPGALARTANSFAFQIVQAAAGTSTEQPRLLTGAEQDHVVAELLAGHEEDGTGPEWPESLASEVRRLQGFRTEFRELMMRCVESGVSPERLRALGRSWKRPEWAAAADLMGEYGDVLDSYASQYRDSAELIAEAVHIVEDGRGPEGMDLIVVDDLQEFGPGLHRLLRAFARRGTDIVAFGDPDVAASAFRGSDPGALRQLSDRIGAPVSPHTLRTVHRGSASLRAVVRQVTDRIGAAGGVDHRRAEAAGPTARQTPATATDSDIGVPEPVLRIEAPTPAAEYRQIARVLREHHLLRGTPWERMSVVVRSGSLVPVVSRALALAEVPTSVPVGATSIRDAHASRQLLDAAALALGYSEASAGLVEALLLGPLCGLDVISLRRLKRALRREEIVGGGDAPAERLLVEAVGHPNGFATLDSAAARRAGRFARSLDSAQQTARGGGSIEEILWDLWSSGPSARVWGEQALGTGPVADEANRHLDAVMALFTQAKRFVERYPNDPARGFLDEVFQSEVAEDSLTPQAVDDAVWVGTPNSMVGTEADIVVAAHLQDGAWPNPQLRGSLLNPQALSDVLAGNDPSTTDARAVVLADELRMFALALSRAQEQIVISATAGGDELPSVFFRFRAIDDAPLRDPEEGRHPFTLRGLTGQLRRLAVHGADDAARAAAASALARLAREEVPAADPDHWYGMREPSTREPLVDLSVDGSHVTVSPSKLDTFETSPLAWFIDTMAERPSDPAAGIGTLIHKAMENVGSLPENQQTEAAMSPEALWEHVERRWGELSFDAPWIGSAQARRAHQLVASLSQYLTTALREGASVVSSEGSFSLDIGPVRLRGTIDRVERRPDGSIVVVDLKTGKTRPTKSELPEHAQLCAYQLAVSRGAVPGADPAHSGGAALLFVAPRTPGQTSRTGRMYDLKSQDAADDEANRAFEQRVLAAGEGMSGAEFPGADGLKPFDPAAGTIYRIHLIAAVSE